MRNKNRASALFLFPLVKSVIYVYNTYMFRILTVAEDDGRSDRVSLRHTGWRAPTFEYSAQIDISFTHNNELVIKVDNIRQPIQIKDFKISDIDSLIECLQQAKEILSEELLVKN